MLPLHCLLVERRIVIPAEQTQQEQEHRRQKKHYARARANQTGTTRPDIINIYPPSSALGRSACGGTSASNPASRRTPPSNQSTKRLSPDILAEPAGEEQPAQTGRGTPEAHQRHAGGGAAIQQAGPKELVVILRPKIAP